jgi:L-malate glycosyltransferase
VSPSADRSLRVLMVDSEKSWRGGQEQMRLLMSGLIEVGVDVILAAPADGMLYARVAPLAIERVPWRGTATPASVMNLRRTIARLRPDVVHSHASRAHGAVSAARLGLRPRPWHVVSRRVDFPVAVNPASAWKYRRGADAYIAISDGVRTVLIAGGVPASSVHLAPSGIDLEKFAGRRDRRDVRREFGLDDATPVIGNIAALAPHKAQDDLLRAAALVFATHPDARLVVVGEGALRGELESLAGRLGIVDRVVFTGFRDDALDLLGMFDCFVMSSRLEGLGTSIMDAQAAGIPVVATRTGGIPEIVKDGATGLLVSPDDPPSLAAAISRMLSDVGLRERCVQNAKTRSAGYDYHRTVYKTLDVYRRLCQNGRSPLERLVK